MIKTLGVAVGLVGLGMVVLGLDWTGVEVAPGVWRDRVSLLRWIVFGACLFVSGVAAAHLLPQWRERMAAVVPLLLWYGWQLRHGTIWPIALGIYGGATILLWVAACLTPTLWQRHTAAPPYREPTPPPL